MKVELDSAMQERLIDWMFYAEAHGGTEGKGREFSRDDAVAICAELAAKCVS